MKPKTAPTPLLGAGRAALQCDANASSDSRLGVLTKVRHGVLSDLRWTIVRKFSRRGAVCRSVTGVGRWDAVTLADTPIFMYI